MDYEYTRPSTILSATNGLSMLKSPFGTDSECALVCYQTEDTAGSLAMYFDQVPPVTIENTGTGGMAGYQFTGAQNLQFGSFYWIPVKDQIAVKSQGFTKNYLYILVWRRPTNIQVPVVENKNHWGDLTA